MQRDSIFDVTGETGTFDGAPDGQNDVVKRQGPFQVSVPNTVPQFDGFSREEAGGSGNSAIRSHHEGWINQVINGGIDPNPLEVSQ